MTSYHSNRRPTTRRADARAYSEQIDPALMHVFRRAEPGHQCAWCRREAVTVQVTYIDRAPRGALERAPNTKSQYLCARCEDAIQHMLQTRARQEHNRRAGIADQDQLDLL